MSDSYQKTNEFKVRQHGNMPERDRPPRRIDISIVVPLYNEEQSLMPLSLSIRDALDRMNYTYEVIFVDDGSTDNSLRVLKDIHRKNRRYKFISFRKNYGKSAALSVGFQHSLGRIIVTMDADLQDDPNEIPHLVEKLESGYDLVNGWKRKRHDPISKTIPSRFFNFTTSLLTGIRLRDFNSGLKAYKREVVQDIKVYGEMHRFLPVMAQWAGYRIAEIPVIHHPRKYGKTKFGLNRFWHGLLDLITVLFTTRYSKRPLHFFGVMGLLTSLLGFAIDLELTIEWLMGKTAISNRPLFTVGIVLIIVGIQFVSIGLLGEMVTRTNVSEEYSIKEKVFN
ncbi:MAG TPA: glycosyltransferase family 2 protein [Candidatus Acidoferrales bacterium]|nr:glycosyltransferase family 2 protein [Candidatus Acidoferrales bacterium]